MYQEQLCGILGCSNGIIISVFLLREIIILWSLLVWEKLDCRDGIEGSYGTKD